MPHSSGLNSRVASIRWASSLAHVEGPHLRGARGVLLAQGVALPPRGHEDAAQVGMAVNRDAEHVPDFALVPVGVGPEVGDGAHGGVLAVEGHLDPHVLVSLQGDKVVDDAEVGRRLALAVRPRALVDGRDVQEHGVGAAAGAFQPGEGRQAAARRSPTRWGCRPWSAGEESMPAPNRSESSWMIPVRFRVSLAIPADGGTVRFVHRFSVFAPPTCRPANAGRSASAVRTAWRPGGTASRSGRPPAVPRPRRAAAFRWPPPLPGGRARA